METEVPIRVYDTGLSNTARVVLWVATGFFSGGLLVLCKAYVLSWLVFVPYAALVAFGLVVTLTRPEPRVLLYRDRLVVEGPWGGRTIPRNEMTTWKISYGSKASRFLHIGRLDGTVEEFGLPAPLDEEFRQWLAETARELT